MTGFWRPVPCCNVAVLQKYTLLRSQKSGKGFCVVSVFCCCFGAWSLFGDVQLLIHFDYKPSKHPVSDPKAFWLRPVMAITTSGSVQPHTALELKDHASHDCSNWFGKCLHYWELEQNAWQYQELALSSLCVWNMYIYACITVEFWTRFHSHLAILSVNMYIIINVQRLYRSWVWNWGLIFVAGLCPSSYIVFKFKMSGDTSAAEKPEAKRLMFRDITADDDEPEITEMESLCVNCEEQVMLWRGSPNLWV